jgi:hypothetical protein
VCRNIKTLFNFEPPATEEEVRDASLQFVRKISGSTKPSSVNQEVFDHAVEDVTAVVHQLIASLTTHALPKDRDIEAAKARARNQQRFGGNLTNG